MNKKQINIVACLVLVITSIITTPSMAARDFYKSGVVAARSLVLGPNGQPIYVEFDESGNVDRTIGEAIGRLENLKIISADVYRMQVLVFNDFRNKNKKGSARGAKIISRDEYESTDFGSIQVPGTVADAQGNFIPETKKIAKPSLRPDTVSVYVRDKKTIVIPGDGPILFESTINLRNPNDYGEVVLGDNPPSGYIRSLLLNEEGDVVEESSLNIGFRSAFFSSENRAEAVTNTDKDREVSREEDDITLGPMRGINVFSSLSRRQVGISNEEGMYSLTYLSPPCPGFTHEYEHDLIAQIPFKNFNPKASQPWSTYPANLKVYDICNGIGQGAPGTSLSALSAQQNAQAIVATQVIPRFNADIKVDVILLTGEGTISNPNNKSVELGSRTEYAADIPNFDPVNPANLDLNADRKDDELEKLTENTVGVFFPKKEDKGSDGAEPVVIEDKTEPDLVVRADAKLEDLSKDQGLLKTINPEDLEDTDLYVFRASNDQLITQRKGLKREEYVLFNDTGVSEDENLFFYKLLIRGTRQQGFITGELEDFQEKTQINKKLIGREVDFLRNGEEVKIIAINRVTGYIGTVTVKAGVTTNGNLNVPINKLILRPPNLKIRAERMYTVQVGLTKDKERTYLIGSEGSALTSDTTVVIRSEWLDHDGTPLPANLEGYTGRLAQVVGDNALQAVAGEYAQFDISPGTKLQLVQLSQADIGRQHYYLQVSGEYEKDNPSFDVGNGAGTGPLQYRPEHYVPILVPVLDEATTRERKNQLIYARQDELTEEEDVEAVYKWVYRPEMHFSVFDLKINEFNITDADDNTRTEKPSSDLFYLDGTDNEFTINYDLQADSDGPPLAGFGPARELLFAVGGDEQLANTESGQTLTFTNLQHLADVASSDLLSVRLYQNSDSENVLYEYALHYSEMFTDFNRDGKIIAENELFDDKDERTDAVTKEKPHVFWLNDDDDDPDSETDGSDIDATSSFAFGFGNDPDYENKFIDGSRDLIDFFPVSLNLHRFIRNIDPKVEYTYRLKQADAAVNIVYTEMDRDNSDAYLNELDVSSLTNRETDEPVFATWESAGKLSEVSTHRVARHGIDLPPEFLDLMKKDEDKGVFIVEARLPSEKPLVLEVTNTEGKIVIRTELALNLVKLESMHRRISLRNNNEDTLSRLWGDNITAPNISEVALELKNQKSTLEVPDTLDKDRHVVFVHGFNVSEDAAIENQNETFKRLHHSGSNMLFTGISWNGDDGPPLDYWVNVENAFYTADDLASVVTQEVTGSEVVVLGHSLGNMVISSAITHFDMRVDKFIMLNPAIAVEAFSKTQLNPVEMRNTDWDEFYDTDKANKEAPNIGGFAYRPSRRLWATEWHDLFNDNRKLLSWRGMFEAVFGQASIVQFYSSGEDVLQRATEGIPLGPSVFDGLGTNSWSVQEKVKGTNTVAASLMTGDVSGGWGFNSFLRPCPQNVNGCITSNSLMEPDNAFSISDPDLRTTTFFRGFRDDLTGDNGNIVAEINFPYILGNEIPALSFAAGAIAIDRISSQINMNDIPMSWPEERGLTVRWRHSDYKNVAYLYTHPLFENMVIVGNMR